MMDLDLLQVSAPSLAYICLGGFVVLLSMMTIFIKDKLYINEVLLGTGFGILIGPHVAGIFDPRSWGSDSRITLEVMRVVLATGLFTIGVELPKSYMWDHMKGLLVMVVPTMAFGWVLIALIIYYLFPSINYISSLCIAACLTPTDPIICAAIVSGTFAKKNVKEKLRHILSAESAANDGLAYPFLSISIYLTVEASTRVAIGKWFLVGWLYQVILGTVIGAVIGLIFSRIMKLSHAKGLIGRESYVVQYIALVIFTIGVASTIGSDDLLAAFAAGCAISWDGHFSLQTENEIFASVIDFVLNCACFIYIGAWLPFAAFHSPELDITIGRLVTLVIAILFLRRIPPLLLLYKFVPEITTWKEALFCGHFGPLGVGAVFISTMALTRLPTPESPPANQAQFLAATLQTIVAFVVLGSIIVHGLSIPFISFGRTVPSRVQSMTITWTMSTHAPREWLSSIRRFGSPLPPYIQSEAISDVDPEQAVMSSNNPNGVEIHGPSISEVMSQTSTVTMPGAPGAAESIDILPPGPLGEVLNRLSGDVSEVKNIRGDCEETLVREQETKGDDVRVHATDAKSVRFPDAQ